MKQKITKVLIANRGEIAVRIIRTLRKMQIKSVAVYAENDAKALHVSMADESFSLGSGSLTDTYLSVEKLINCTLESGAQAIHPGYGFLSENPTLVTSCEKNNIIFIGPDSQSMELMGNKITARDFAVKCGLPVTQGIIGDTKTLLQKANEIPFPILVKAAAGGGGKGMRIVRKPDELAEIIETTGREAKSYFGDGTVYIEQFIENPRHIEVQVLGDEHGNVVHLYERECSIQRRYQKIIEESPSPTLTQEVREKMGKSAVDLCKAIGYRSAGTIEFLVDPALNFYFLEMNTRIQVEHPVTELVTNIDLVEEQLYISQGEKLRFSQTDIKQTGHAIECRIYAEDPAKGFLPSPGQIINYQEPHFEGLRIDSGLSGPAMVQSEYDPMISKLIGFGEDRQTAIETAQKALQEYVIHGIETNIPYLNAILSNDQFINNEISTGFCDTETERLLADIIAAKSKIDSVKVAAAFLLFNLHQHELEGFDPENTWQQLGYWRLNMQPTIRIEEQLNHFEVISFDHSGLVLSHNKQKISLRLTAFSNKKMAFCYKGKSGSLFISENEEGHYLVQYEGFIFNCERKDQLNEKIDHARDADQADEGSLFSPMPGKVIKINVKSGDKVNRGGVLLVVEAMKMENNITAPADSVVEKVLVKTGDMVQPKTQLIQLKTKEEA